MIDLEALLAAGADIGYPVALKTAEKGVRVIVQRMAGRDIELAFGCVLDPDFVALVMVSAGGTLIEHFDYLQFALAPFDERKALRMIEKLSVARLLASVRGSMPKNKLAEAKALPAFSRMYASLSARLHYLGVPPVYLSRFRVNFQSFSFPDCQPLVYWRGVRLLDRASPFQFP